MHHRGLALNALTAALAFLVLTFGYRLVGGETPGFAALFAVALLVGVVAAAATWVAMKRRV